MHRKLISLAALAVAIAAITGVGYAAIPSSNGVISACKDSKGTLKVIDAEAGQTCNANQQPLTWNQQGPAGSQGPAGPQGAPGSSLGHAYVSFTGDVWGGTLTSANVVRAATGRYCFGGLGFNPQTAVVTLAWQSPTPGTGIPRVRIASSDSVGRRVRTMPPQYTNYFVDVNEDLR